MAEGGDRIQLAEGDYGPFEGLEQDAVVFGAYRRDGTWSASLVELLGQLLTDGGTLLDVGANIGLVTVPVIERSTARALCFEPEPACHRLLRQNLARHRLLDRVETFPVALSDRAGPGTLSVDAENRGDNRLCRADDPRGVRVTLARLDEVLGEAAPARPLVMKLDAQGAEVAVLRGARRSLPQIDHLLIEYWPYGLHRQGAAVDELWELLADFPLGTVLPQDGPPPTPGPRQALRQSLAWVPTDGSDRGFFDLWLCRAPPASRGL